MFQSQLLGKTMTHFFFFFLVEIQIKCTQFEEGNLWYIMAHTSGAQSWAGSTCLCWCEESLTFPSAVMPISPFIHSLTRQAKAHYHPQITHKDTVLRQRFTLLATMRRISPFKHRIWAELAGQHARGWTFFFFFFFKCFKLKVWPCLKKKMLIQIRGINISPVRKALKQYQTLQRVLLHPDWSSIYHVSNPRPLSQHNKVI